MTDADTRPSTRNTFAPPVQEARRWLEGVRHPEGRPLINVSQAAPVAPPPEPLRAALAETVMSDTAAHLYGPTLGLPELRSEIASQWSASYGGQLDPAEVAITSGCNQAFCAAIAALCGPGDEVILPVPWYFNHAMWLDMAGVLTRPLATGADMLPDPDEAAKLITPRTRAIILVSPNNPTGAEYPAALMEAFFDLAASHGLALIVDETYRDFDSRSGAPHGLFEREEWSETLIHFYSFSKAYRLTGHRVGAMVASQGRIAEAEKFLDTVSVCPNQLGQRAALWGMQNLSQWLAGERAEILARRAAIEKGFPRLAAKGWELMGCGAYFAYVRHPFEASSAKMAPQMVRSAGVLTLPGTMFRPEGDRLGAAEFRIAFANVDSAGIDTLFTRLENLTP